MALRVIRKNEDPVLREKSMVVKKINSNVLKLIDDMFDTMYDADGVGLAAPQVGILKRVIVVDTGENEKFALINPEIIIEKEIEKAFEGCLSFPGLTGEVSRSGYVKVKALDCHGVEVSIEAQGLLARALQHEIDHLNGIVLVDQAENIQKIN